MLSNTTHDTFQHCTLRTWRQSVNRHAFKQALILCESAGIDLTFTITFLNPGGWFYSHFTVDEQGLLGMFMGWTAMYLVGCVAYGYAQYQLYRWVVRFCVSGIGIWAYKYECKFTHTRTHTHTHTHTEYQSFHVKFRVRIFSIFEFKPKDSCWVSCSELKPKDDWFLVQSRSPRILAWFLVHSRSQRTIGFLFTVGAKG